MLEINRVTTVLKVETNIITSITASLITAKMYVEIFKTDIIVFIGNVIMCLMSYWPIIFNTFIATDNMTLWDQKKNVQITDKKIYSETWVNRNTVHSDLNFKSPVFSLIIFVKNHWINRTLHIPNSGLDLRSQYTNYCYNLSP